MASLHHTPLRARLALKYAARVQEQFVCKRCLHQRQQQPAPKPWERFKAKQQTPFLRAFKTPDRLLLRTQSSAPSAASPTASSPLGALSQRITHRPPPHASSTTSSTTSSSSFPDRSSPAVGYFLLASAASVFGIVVFGGLTRLTESGLSITEWRPVTGSFPPTTPEAWEAEFALYRLSPEFKMLNSRMNVDEFKQIYWMEWGHRLWGRMVGLTFLLPTAYFILRRRVDKRMAGRLLGIGSLIGFQGVIGWWMVKSGLKDDLLETGSHPRVSQYRLTAHLGTAFLAYLAMLWNGTLVLRESRLLANPTHSLQSLLTLRDPILRPFRRALTVLAALTFTTALSGALVAGLDAGLVYNDFPWMGRPNLLPPSRELLDPFYSHTPSHADILWRNICENPVLAQLDHRLLATTTFSAILALAAYSRFSPATRALLPPNAKTAVRAVVGLACLQVTMGITTLWYLVPTPLAAAHQAGALALLSGVLVLGSRVWVPRRTFALVRQAAKLGESRAKAGRIRA
ncbi:hypothetical protein B0A50_08501 [Salinomyces thailandicus]|uniref:Uncharacterized protein n=1 Tax=Salinomyces thailandicus TaxID=706561 RepID=A0A4U0TJI6_9PEZI|nr:hypothetical protein B0A50_08501 [Salinomyces thailandica]